MKYTKFIIKKFKGIDKLELDLTKYPTSKVFPLVGLNESGKTTILEAINFFQEDLDGGKEHEIIHKRDKGVFSGDVEVEAVLELDLEDQKFINNFIIKKGYSLEKTIESIFISKKYNFKNASFVKPQYTWVWNPSGLNIKNSRQKKFEKLFDRDNPLWVELTDEIKNNLLPIILYFPDFIFKFPERIFLNETPNPSYSGEDKIRQEKYRNVVQDILSSINPVYSLSDLVDKLKSGESQKEESANQILRDMETELNEKILDYWNGIFPNTPRKTIKIEHGKDLEAIYLQIKINEGATTFYIDERSLGFRWFFGFILFTEFRKARMDENGEYLFLFDEPANNLNQTSQQKLLTLFSKITDKAKIIYATHSHHLLDTKFILNAFVIKDDGRETENDYNYRQNIKATPYQQFFAKNPNQQSHFQLILDVLKFVEHPFELTDSIVFFEGKFDYYVFKWIKEQFFNDKYDFKFYPGSGVDKYENVLREYLAHNRKFIAVFDDDGTDTKRGRGGKSARLRYMDEISIELKKNVFTLSHIDNNFSGFETENLFKEDEKIKIQQIFSPNSTEYNKGEFNTGIQQLFIEGKNFELSEDTKNNFKKIFDFIKNKFSELEK